jgi:hypothetical protein
MKAQIKIHDGIVGAVMLLGIILGLKVDSSWLYLPGAIAVLMISSAFTGFCPVYFLLKKLMPGDAAQ